MRNHSIGCTLIPDRFLCSAELVDFSLLLPSTTRPPVPAALLPSSLPFKSLHLATSVINHPLAFILQYYVDTS